MPKNVDEEKFNEKEAQQRFEAALKGALNTPPKPLKEIPKVKPHKSGVEPLTKPQARPKGK